MSSNENITAEQPEQAPETVESLKATIASLTEENASLKANIARLGEENASLKECVARLQRMLFGKKSEKVVSDPSQLLPGMQEILAKQEEAEKGEAQKEEEKVKVGEHEREKRPGHRNAGWNGFPEDLEREERIIDIPEDERQGLQFIGYETSERLVHRSAYVVQVLKRAKYAEKGAPGFGVVTADAPKTPSCLGASSDRCHYDVTVIVHVIAEKLVDHIPFYRQSEMFARLGIEFGRSAMSTYFAKVSAALTPLYKVMAETVMACAILHADETRVLMLLPKTGGSKTCWIWVRRTGLGPPLTVFHFAKDRSKTTARELLGDYLGTLIRDSYAAYADLPAEAAGCWAHCRRHFFEAKENHPDYASRALELVRLLYLNEQRAREVAEARTSETALFKQRSRFRRQSEPLVAQYFALCQEIQATQPPSSAIAKAAAYSTRQEEQLRRFLKDPRVNIDNNPCENVIRPFCLGRKNWLFVGSEDGGTSMAVLASFAATCKDNGVNFEEWLCDVLGRLDTCRTEDLKTLLPHNWKAARCPEPVIQAVQTSETPSALTV